MAVWVAIGVQVAVAVCVGMGDGVPVGVAVLVAVGVLVGVAVVVAVGVLVGVAENLSAEEDAPLDIPKIAVIGRPNVGKFLSSML